MTFTNYSDNATTMAIYPGKSEEALTNLWYPCLGLAGEVGEVIEPIKKYFRQGKELDVEHIKLELGDVLWYLTDIGRRLGLSLEEIAQANIDKLTERRKRDKPTTGA